MILECVPHGDLVELGGADGPVVQGREEVERRVDESFPARPARERPGVHLGESQRDERLLARVESIPSLCEPACRVEVPGQGVGVGGGDHQECRPRLLEHGVGGFGPLPERTEHGVQRGHERQAGMSPTGETPAAEPITAIQLPDAVSLKMLENENEILRRRLDECSPYLKDGETPAQAAAQGGQPDPGGGGAIGRPP